MNLRTIMMGVSLLAGIGGHAHDFSVVQNGQRIFFDITNKVKKTAMVTYKGSIKDKQEPEVAGTIEIPSKIKHDNVVYEVTAIGPKAFANAKRLKGVVIPSGIETIGDFAFEGCDSLGSVVFPGNVVTLGQGVFFRCPMIEHVTVGSDWKAIDLAMFRWSEKLATINIPAKVEKIQGLKKLVGLETVTVDPNNGKFASHDNMLYSKDGAILYACPRAYSGKVVVKEGTAKVHPGALADCMGITALDFPATLKEISFLETAKLNGLEYILLRAETPIITGYKDGTGKFLLQTASKEVQIVVPAKAKNAYLAVMATGAGEYAVSPSGGIPYFVPETEMPSKKQVKGVKNFDNYK